MPHARGSDLVLLHRLKQSGLCFGRRPVDFISEDHVRKNRAAHEKHFPSLASVLQDFGAGNVGRHEVGGELDALEFEMEDPGNGLDQQRLGQSRRPRNQAMTARQQRDKNLFDDLMLPNNYLGQLGNNLVPASGEAFDRFAFGAVGWRNLFLGSGFNKCIHSMGH